MLETALPILFVARKRVLLWATIFVLFALVWLSTALFAQVSTGQSTEQTASVGNYVWDDANADGIQGAYIVERPLSGVVVSLYHASGLLADMTITNSDGEYAFQFLAPGDYYLGFTAPTMMVATMMHRGDDAALDSDADPITGLTSVFTLEAGEENQSIDVGFTQLASISSWVWHDENVDGARNPQAELGVPAAVVTLYNEFDQVVQSVPTDVDGYFTFPTITPGAYRIAVTPPPGMTFTTSGALRTSSFGSNINPITGQSELFDVHVGPNILEWGIGLMRIAAPTSLNTMEEPRQDIESGQAAQPAPVESKQYLPIINFSGKVDATAFMDGPVGFALR